MNRLVLSLRPTLFVGAALERPMTTELVSHRRQQLDGAARAIRAGHPAE